MLPGALDRGSRKTFYRSSFLMLFPWDFPSFNRLLIDQGYRAACVQKRFYRFLLGSDVEPHVDYWAGGSPPLFPGTRIGVARPPFHDAAYHRTNSFWRHERVP